MFGLRFKETWKYYPVEFCFIIFIIVLGVLVINKIIADKDKQSICKCGDYSMNEFKEYRKKNSQSMRPYIVGEDMSAIAVSDDAILEEGGMIAVSLIDPTDIWYVNKKFFEENYVLI